MKKLFTCVFIVVFGMTLQAQRHEVGIEVGANTYAYLKSGLKDLYKKIPGVQEGITYRYNFKQKSSLAVSLWYQKKGYRNIIDAGLENKNPYNDAYLTGLSVPIYYKYAFTKTRLQPYITAGVVNTLFCSSVFNKYNKVDTYTNQGSINMLKYKVWHMDVMAGAGVDYRLSSQFKVSLNFIYSYTYAFVSKQMPAYNMFGHVAYLFPNTYIYNVSLRYIFAGKVN